MSVCIILLSCMMSPPASAQKKAAPAAAPIYPIWPADALPPSKAAVTLERLPEAISMAIPIAKGYLIAPLITFDRVARDFSRNPEVYVFDGKRLVVGRVVDVSIDAAEMRMGREMRVAPPLVFIRADVDGEPVALSGQTSAVAIVSLLPKGTKRVPTPISTAAVTGPCAYGGQPLPMPGDCSICVMADGNVAGGMMIDEKGRLAGLVTKKGDRGGHPLYAGVSAAKIREFVEGYFSSWGRGIKKPKF